MAKRLTGREIQDIISFTESVVDTSRWVRMAEELMGAAALLEPTIRARWDSVKIVDGSIVFTADEPVPNVEAQYFMLAAYALEDYLKALWLLQTEETRRNRALKTLPTEIKTHRLDKLADKVGISLSVPEQDLLLRLERNSVWAARYPVPIGPDTKQMQQYSDGKWYLTAYFAPDDVERTKFFIERVIGLISVTAQS